MKYLVILALLVTCSAHARSHAVLSGSVSNAFVWSPTNTASSGPALAWWEVETSYVTNTGNAILTDLTGNGYNLRAPVADAPPRTNNVVGSTYDGIVFLDSATRFLTNGPITASHPIDVLMVYNINTNASGSYIFSSTNSSFEGSFIDGSTRLYMNAGANLLNTVNFGTTYGVMYLRFDSTTASTIAWNNAVIINGSAGANNLNGFTLGQRYDRSSGTTFNFVAGYVFTNLQSADTINANTYITNRFNIVQ